MKCPHCGQHYSERLTSTELGWDEDGRWTIAYCFCENEECQRLIARIHCYPEAPEGSYDNDGILTAKGGGRYYYCKPRLSRDIHPLSARRPLSQNVPAEYRVMFDEACLVLRVSPNSSAAISRRCLQHLIRKEYGITRDNLKQEIDGLLEKPNLKPDLIDQLHEVREMGNMGVHDWIDTATGEIVNVEPEHAEALLEILESIFEVKFAAPAELQKQIDGMKKSREGIDRRPKYDKNNQL